MWSTSFSAEHVSLATTAKQCKKFTHYHATINLVILRECRIPIFKKKVSVNRRNSLRYITAAEYTYNPQITISSYSEKINITLVIFWREHLYVIITFFAYQLLPWKENGKMHEIHNLINIPRITISLKKPSYSTKKQ